MMIKSLSILSSIFILSASPVYAIGQSLSSQLKQMSAENQQESEIRLKEFDGYMARQLAEEQKIEQDRLKKEAEQKAYMQTPAYKKKHWEQMQEAKRAGEMMTRLPQMVLQNCAYATNEEACTQQVYKNFTAIQNREYVAEKKWAEKNNWKVR